VRSLPTQTLRPKLRERDAADIIHALMSPEVYRLLAGDRGWPPERYEQWLKDTRTEPPATTSRYRSVRAGYWLATALVAGEMALGGIWDITRIPFVADLVRHLGYPSYFLVLPGSWKVLSAVALLIPRHAPLKEWAYAGAFFTYTGAIVSHLVTGYDLAEVGLLAVLTTLTVLSWALRPPSRRTSRRMSAAPLAAAVGDTAGVAHTTAAIGHPPRVQAKPPRLRVRRGSNGERHPVLPTAAGPCWTRIRVKGLRLRSRRRGADCHQAETDARHAHVERLAEALRYEPCSPTCANWLR